MQPKKNLPNFHLSHRLPPRELSTLLKVSGALGSSLELPVVLQTAIESAVEVLRLDTGAIYLLEGDQLFLGATTPPLLPELHDLLTRPELLEDHPHLRDSLRLEQPIHIADFRTASLSPAETAICEARHLRSILFIPLILKENALGALIVGTNQKIREFDDSEINLCRLLSYQISMAVANARLFRFVQQSNIELTAAYDATLLGWSLALEMRDQETQGHTLRVTQLAEDLAHKFGFNENELVYLRRGALLHDIGKMGIPDAILRKEGPLTDDEWAVMRTHPERAYQFLKHIPYLAPAVDIPYCHHEKWDGSGYPRGLSGEDIPRSARIFAVVDVFDALTSDRSYRPAWCIADALQYLRDQTGRHFDPLVVEIFLTGFACQDSGEKPNPSA